MIAIVGAFLGAIYGAWRARKRGGNRLDLAQYAAVHALIFALAGVFVTIAIERLLQ